MFALKRKTTDASPVNANVARTAAGMFLFFAALRAAPWVIAKFRGA